MSQKFDFKAAVAALQNGQDLTGKDGILTPLIKQLTEAALKAELEAHLEEGPIENRKNGYGIKTIKTLSGNFDLETPRDRTGSFEPQLVRKHQTTLTDEIERKIISMFGLGMSHRNTAEHIADIYGLDISTSMISRITDKIIPELRAWQERPLESHYPFVWLDAIHYKVKIEGRYQSRAVYTVLGLDIHGTKDILGIYISEAEGANFWLSVLTDLQLRGVEDILIACVDGLTGFPEAINSIFPKTQVQLCVIHQIRNSIKYVAHKNKKAFMEDLNNVYRAATLDAAEMALDDFEDKWGKKYPIVLKSWRRKWENLSVYFQYPEQIRKIIYTTNTIESVHRQFRKLTKSKGAFPNETSLMKLLYMGIQNASKKWTRPIKCWNLTLTQLAIYFEGRLEDVLDV